MSDCFDTKLFNLKRNVSWLSLVQEFNNRTQPMETFNDVSVEDLIDYNVDESTGFQHSSWTEQALDLFISNLKNAKKSNFPDQRKMLEVIKSRMLQKGYRFSIEQIEKKYNSLRKMFTEKRERNQMVEPELYKLFSDVESNHCRSSQQEHVPVKRARWAHMDDGNDSMDDGDDKRIIWSPIATKAFLDLLERLRPQLGTKLATKRLMWLEIARQLGDQGHHFTAPQVENKWKALLRHYRNRLEVIRSGIYKPQYNSWPDMFDDILKVELKGLKERTECKEQKEFMEQSNTIGVEAGISFANDQKLPYDENDGTDEENFEFEETVSLPYVEINSDEPDPVLINESMSAFPESDDKPSPSNLAMERIANEIFIFRQDNRKHQDELLRLEKRKLEAYKQRTAQFGRIAEELGRFMTHFKRSASNDNI